ncbi:MAG: sigma-70 family RNA polymerase sigma factor [Candidatus Omnitrophica bacterium]|nr:sigma-70 family RNA polymerase sigma factor [Candidatus Omnitrophota bacterium]
MSDTDLLRQIQKGNESALEEILRRFQAKIYGLSLRMLRHSQDAEEVLQDVALTVFQKAGTFKGEAAVSSWVYRITVNACLMKIRRRPKVQSIPLEEELGPAMNEEGMIAEPVADWTSIPRDELERKELAARIEEAVGELPPEYRAVFVLRDVEGLSAEAACHVLNLSLPALKSRLHRARLFLRKKLADCLLAGHMVPVADPPRESDA